MVNSESTDIAYPLLQIDARDNVGVVVQNCPAGTRLRMYGRECPLEKDVPLGHKIALEDIKAGAQIFKYGFVIGAASADITIGEHVHVHNVKSNYLPTYTFDQGEQHDR